MFYDFLKEIGNDLKEDLKSFKSFTKKDWLEGIAITVAIAMMIVDTILAILIFH